MEIGLDVLTAAFMISKPRRIFEISVLPFIPFPIIDLTVSSILMAFGMVRAPPTSVALPFELISFDLVDGWSLPVGSPVQNYGVKDRAERPASRQRQGVTPSLR